MFFGDASVASVFAPAIDPAIPAPASTTAKKMRPVNGLGLIAMSSIPVPPSIRLKMIVDMRSHRSSRMPIAGKVANETTLITIMGIEPFWVAVAEVR
jgi:hypothetical protein